MRVDDVAIVDQRAGVGEHRFGFGREARDQVGTDCDLGTAGLQPFDDPNRIGARVATLHAPKDHIVSGLERQMQVRHDPRLTGHQVE